MEYSVDAAVLDGWNITRLLGEGSYGKVFEIERSEFGQTYRAALKVITVPQSSAEVRSVISEGMSVSQAEAYFHGIVEELMHEFSIMFKLKGTANVVSCEDLRVLEHPDGIGWDILIRMELLHRCCRMFTSIRWRGAILSSSASISARRWSSASDTT